MSLKDFHLVFISFSVILAAWFTYWAYGQYTTQHTTGYLLTAVVSALVAIGLVIYEIAFIKKSKSISK